MSVKKGKCEGHGWRQRGAKASKGEAATEAATATVTAKAVGVTLSFRGAKNPSPS